MSREDIAIKTRDGDCRAFVFTPAGAGPWPAAIFLMDGLGIRPALHEMGQRLADAGYVVLLPDLFYRYGAYEPLDPKVIFASGEARKLLAPMFASTSNQKAGEDSEAYIAFLSARKDVSGAKIGVTGYCMGGGMALTAAGLYPDRIAVAASFHGGRLATDDPMSPHLLAPNIKAFVYVGAAVDDNSYPPDMAARFEQALTNAGVPHRCETYDGALHGWTMPDFPVYNEAAAERHWRELTALFAARLR